MSLIQQVTIQFIFVKNDPKGYLEFKNDRKSFTNALKTYIRKRTSFKKEFIDDIFSHKFDNEAKPFEDQLHRKFLETMLDTLLRFAHKIHNGETLTGLQNSCSFYIPQICIGEYGNHSVCFPYNSVSKIVNGATFCMHWTQQRYLCN